MELPDKFSWIFWMLSAADSEVPDGDTVLLVCCGHFNEEGLKVFEIHTGPVFCTCAVLILEVLDHHNRVYIMIIHKLPEVNDGCM